MEKILYERKGERIDWESFGVDSLSTEDSHSEKELPPIKPPEPGEAMRMLEQIERDRTLILLPERYVESKVFIKKAISVAELYDLDTKITEHDSHITVDYSFDCGGDAVFLINVIEMADSISFFTKIFDREVTISLDYYTHAVYLKNRLIAPIDRRREY